MQRRYKIAITAAVVVLACCGAAGRAEAGYPAPAVSWSRGQMNGGARYGSDNLNLGFGARGGYTLPNGIYLGGIFDYFIGESQSVIMGGTSITADAHMWDIAAEGGFDFALTETVMIRPFIGLGIAEASAEICTDQIGGPSCISASNSDTFLEVGGLINVLTGSMMFGGDVRLLAADGSSLVIGGHIGWLF
jgi:hypothetical protein